MLLAVAPAHAQKRIALTFDDAPRDHGAFLTPDQRTEALIAGLKRAGVTQAAFFINPEHLLEPDGVHGAAHIRAYVRAGHVIANHSYDHPALSEVSAADYLSNIDHAARWLKGRTGLRSWFRYPYLDEGSNDKVKRDAVRAGLRKRGLMDAYVTVDGSDWNFEDLTLKAVAAHKAVDMAALRDLYVETLVGASDYYDGLAVRTLGRSPAHVLLLHETDMNALFVDDLVAALRKDGWEIITPDEAYADPIHTAVTDTPSAKGTLTEMLAWQKGLPAPRWYDRDDLRIVDPLFFERVLHEKPVPAAAKPAG